MPTQAAIEKYSSALAGHPRRDDTKLSISPFAYFVQEKPGEFRIRVLLRATLTTQKGKKLWTNRYYCPSVDVHPLEGEGSWPAGNRYELTATSHRSHHARSCSRTYWASSRPGREIRVETGVTWNARVEYPAKVLEENDDWLAVRLFRDNNLADDVDLVESGMRWSRRRGHPQ